MMYVVEVEVTACKTKPNDKRQMTNANCATPRHGDTETRRHGDTDTETQRHRDTETGRKETYFYECVFVEKR